MELRYFLPSGATVGVDVFQPLMIYVSASRDAMLFAGRSGGTCWSTAARQIRTLRILCVYAYIRVYDRSIRRTCVILLHVFIYAAVIEVRTAAYVKQADGMKRWICVMCHARTRFMLNLLDLEPE